MPASLFFMKSGSASTYTTCNSEPMHVANSTADLVASSGLLRLAYIGDTMVPATLGQRLETAGFDEAEVE